MLNRSDKIALLKTAIRNYLDVSHPCYDRECEFEDCHRGKAEKALKTLEDLLDDDVKP